jgi:hypothetical protein
LRLVLPLAKGYAHHNPVGSNAEYISIAEEALSTPSPTQDYKEHGEEVKAHYNAVVKKIDEAETLEEVLAIDVTKPTDPRDEEIKRLKELFQAFLSVIATCNQINTPEWMEYLAEHANEFCDEIGIDERLCVNKRGNIGFVERYALGQTEGK